MIVRISAAENSPQQPTFPACLSSSLFFNGDDFD
jgi:hypothetical protein